jgi:hypothetical protein
VTDFNELIENLTMSLLGEDWEKSQQRLAKKHPESEYAYHAHKEQMHTDLAKLHQAAADVAEYYPDESKKHIKGDMDHHEAQLTKHYNLAVAHGKMKQGLKEPDSYDPAKTKQRELAAKAARVARGEE